MNKLTLKNLEIEVNQIIDQTHISTAKAQSHVSLKYSDYDPLVVKLLIEEHIDRVTQNYKIPKVKASWWESKWWDIEQRSRKRCQAKFESQVKILLDTPNWWRLKTRTNCQPYEIFKSVIDSIQSD